MSNNGQKIGLAAFCCTAVLAGAAGAAVLPGGESGPAPAAPPLRVASSVDAVVVTANRGSAAAQAPVQATLTAIEPQAVVTQRFIDDYVPLSSDYSQTIKFTPSFSFSAPNGTGGSESKSQVLRGFVDGQYNVTMDGVPFGDSNDYTHHTTSFFLAGVLGGVTVDRGPGQADTVGYATFGGTVGLHSRAFTAEPSGILEASFGSYSDISDRVEGQSGTLNKSGTRVLVDYVAHRTDGALTYAGLHSQQVAAKIEQPLGSKWVATVFGSFNHTLYQNWTGITPRQLALYGKSFGALNDNPASVLYRGDNYKFKNTDLEYVDLNGSVGPVEVENKVYTYGYRNKERNGANQTDLGVTPTGPTPGYGSLVGPKGNLDVTGNRTLSYYRDYGDILDVGHRFIAGWASGRLKAGVWAEHQDSDRALYNVDFTLGGIFNAAPGANPYGFSGKNALGVSGTGAFVYQLHSRVDVVQPFIEYEWSPLPNVTITPGFKHVDFTRHQQGPVNQTSLLPIDVKPHFAADLGFISGNWRIDPSFSAYAQVAQGFLAPNSNTLNTADLTKNDFQPQHTVNYQVGLVLSTRRLTADIDLYRIDFSNFITTATDFTVSPNQSYSINGGGVVYQGVEAEGTLVLGGGVSVYAGGSLNSAKTTGSDRRSGGDLWVAGAPDYTLAFGPIAERGPFYGSLLAKSVGTRYFGANRTNLHLVNGQLVPTAAAQIVDPVTAATYRSNRLGPYTTADLTLGYRVPPVGPFARLGKPLRLELQVQNLFDSRRATDTNGRLGKGDVVDPVNTTYQYLPGRSFYGTIALAF